MRKLAALFLLMATTAEAYNFDQWFPYFYGNVRSNVIWIESSTPIVNSALTSTPTVGWSTDGTQKFTRVSERLVRLDVPRPSIGLWGFGPGWNVMPVPVVTVVEAGFFKLNTAGELVLSTNRWYDMCWKTNATGEIVPRSHP